MTATTKTDCQATGMCHYDSLSRPRFFDGMLLTDESLLEEQRYHRESLKRVNRYLWGSGIICGLKVESVTGLCIRVGPGAALDCQGNLIEVCRCVSIDLTDTCKEKWPGACISKDAGDITKYLVVRYGDIGTDSQAVLAADAECAGSGNGTTCQFSKTREGFCFELVDKCPVPRLCPEDDGMLAAYEEARQEAAEGQAGKIHAHVVLAQGPPGAPVAPVQGAAGAAPAQSSALDILGKEPSMDDTPSCPACGCDESTVGLARLVIHCGEGTVDVHADCRSYVWTPGLLRALVCKLLMKYDRLANQRVPAVAAKYQFPETEEFLRSPLSGARRTLAYMAVTPDWRTGVNEQLQTLKEALAARPQARPPGPPPAAPPGPPPPAAPRQRARPKPKPPAPQQPGP